MCRIAVSSIAAALVASSALADFARAAEDGQVAFNTHCRNCHSIKEGENRLGPSLHNVFNAEAGTVPDFANYSGALKGFRWDEATLDKFIADPKSISPNTTMIYPTVADPEIRKTIIEFLKANSNK